jgi:hypothetical protein
MSASQALLASLGAILLIAPGCGSSNKSNTGGSGGDTDTGGSGGSTGGSPGTGGSPATGGSPGGTGGSGGSTGGAGGSVTPDAGVDSSGGTPDAGKDVGASGDLAAGVSPMMSFFITSRTGDGNLGGLEGADKICQNLAAAVGLGNKTWHAYLSTQTPKVDAKTRIGAGPWYNVKGVKIADSVDGLHMTSNAMGDTAGNMINAANGLDEKGGSIPTGNPAQQHDILTGSNLDGTTFMGQTCMDWTGQGIGRVGHFNRGGGGMAPNSWNSAHDNAGCTAALITMRGGAGRFYCFAID